MHKALAEDLKRILYKYLLKISSHIGGGGGEQFFIFNALYVNTIQLKERYKMKIQNLPQNTNIVKFNGVKKHTSKPEGLTEHKTTSSDALRSLTLLGAALLAAINISSCSPAKTQDAAQTKTPVIVKMEETEEENTETEIAGIDDKTDEDGANYDFNEINLTPGPKPPVKYEGYASPIALTEGMVAKSNEAIEYIQETIDTMDFIYGEVWNNFPAMYNATKNLDGVTISNVQPGDGTILKDYNTEGDFEEYYNKYGTIAGIAAGKIEPWKDVATGKEAVNLINKLLLEATAGGSEYYEPYTHEHGVIDGKDFINKGELDIIYQVLDELDAINPDTQYVAEIFRNALDNKLEEAADWRNQNSLEAKLEGDKYNFYRSTLADNLDDIKIQAESIKEAKEAYETAKADFVNGNYTPDNKDEKLYDLQEKLNDLYAACNWQINGPAGLNSWNINPNIRISFSDTKEAMEEATALASKFLRVPLKINFPAKDTPTNDKTDSQSQKPGDEIMKNDSEQAVHNNNGTEN